MTKCQFGETSDGRFYAEPKPKNRCTPGDYIWAKPLNNGEFDIPIGGKVTSIEATRIKIKDDDGKEFYISNQQVLKTMHVSSFKGVEDMINLGDLQEYAILRNLHKRYNEKLIYTYTGSMLIAVNPYEILPIYTNAVIQEYRNKRFEERPPHIFAIGDNTYTNMKTNRKNQCIVISGESGAGKTESTKLILQYLASLSGQHSWIEQQILEANPVLEAFGNAKTVRNDNSSRFGKYIDISFNKTGNIQGASIEQYLLEKSRIVTQNEGERNYHIFYSMLAGLSKEEKKRLDLGDTSAYAYLTAGKTLTCEGRNEAKEFSDIMGAFKVLHFTDKEISDIFTLLGSILHLGNVNFKSGKSSHSESSEVSDSHLNEKIAKLIGVNKFDLHEALTKKTIQVHGDKVIQTLSKEQAAESRNAFVKGIYGQLFIFIVEKINSTVSINESAGKSRIGLLDIFGFENFKVNSFEQICINYANENLQQFFVHHIFKLEQEYYNKEGINWSKIAFVDNQEILEMIGMKPMSIFSLIDEESKFPNGTDQTMLSKLHVNHGKNSHYMKPKSDITPAFGVRHFAGDVFYDVQGFLDKNKDSFSQDLRNLVTGSQLELLNNIFKAEADNKNKKTLSSQFRISLDELMKNLSACHPFFVRCIKPNEFKKPGIFDRSLCTRQLRYSGMMETAKIRQAGYPIRYTYIEFVDRFRYLAKAIPPSRKGDCRNSSKKICETVFTQNTDYQLGNTKVFLKHHDNEHLEEQRNKILERYILVIQKNVRGWICRRRYQKLRKAAILLQKHFRAKGYRERYLIMRNGFKRLQATIQSRVITYDFVRMRLNTIKIQARCKGFLARRNRFGQICAMVKQRKIDEIELKKKGVKNYKEDAQLRMQKKLDALNQVIVLEKAQEQTINNNQLDEMIDMNFDFLSQTSSTERENDRNSTKQFDILNDDQEKEDLSEYSFRKYAATHFINTVNYQYSKKALKDSLHLLPTPDDVIASQALWITILRFMGDMSEPKYDNSSIKSTQSVMNLLSETLSRAFHNRKEYQDLVKEEHKMASLRKIEKHKLINMTLKKKNKLLEDVRRGLVEDSYAKDRYDDWLNKRRSNNLEKLHFIIGHGLLRPVLRDEIFAMICKQLTNNYVKSSFARGWILLSLCIGCFPPSEVFANYLKAFIRTGPPGYAPYCEGRLNRAFQNGARTQPPSYLELMATKNKDPIILSVLLMDGSSLKIQVDSASTSEEVLKQIATTINLKDTFGFSLFISIYDKVMSLGSEKDHIMDAISQCEQYAKEAGQQERTCSWKLFIRKEIFAPWHDPSKDSVSTNLIYHQVMKGLKVGEYRCASENDVASLIAMQYYIENGGQISKNVLHTRMAEYMPTYLVRENQHNIAEWENKILHAFSNLVFVKQQLPREQSKEAVVKYALSSWPILFSRFFEALQVSGPQLPKKNVIVAVNNMGIYIFDDQEQILLELSYPYVSSIGFENQPSCKLILNTIEKEEYCFLSLDAENITITVQHILDGLKKESIYCVAVQDYKHPGGADSMLTLKKGDLIVLKNGLKGEDLLTSSWAFGECNGKTGDFPTESIHILPTLQPVSKDILDCFKKDIITVNKPSSKNTVSTAQRIKQYTLANYAAEFFREGKKFVSNKSSLRTIRQNTQEELWKYSNELLYQPLLKKVLVDEKASKLACDIFSAILKYMGDLPAPKAKYCNEYTDKIFTGPLQDDLLKDEVYCQIIRQLTFNRLALSEDRGWELMYLITGLYAPSARLYEELQKFLKSRTHPFVEYCLQRLQKSQKIGPRKFAPYSFEVDAIQHRSMQIFHRIYFPNDTDEAFEVDSMTRSSDICKIIASRLELASVDGFSLFLAISDKVLSIPQDAFFYDFLSEIIAWMRANKPSWGSATAIQAQYQVYFLKKLWVNAQPEKDSNADQIFYYHQEVPKYIKGYHKCTKQDAIKLAALILRAKYENNTAEVNAALQRGIKDVIPADVIKAASTSDWRKKILAEYSGLNMNSKEAKTAFLKIISKWPTFGSTFFEVKQATVDTYPELCLIAINRKGVNIIHPHTKDILDVHDYSQLNNWSSGNTYFHLTIGNIMRQTKLLCETTQGYKMDDLITSYTDYIRNEKMKS